MKKTHRALLSILLVLTLLTALPLTALAMDDNSGSIDSVPAGETMTNNTGTIGTNNGTITNNGTVAGGDSSGRVDNNQAVKTETGYQENTGYIENNYGTVVTNGKDSEKNKDSGKVQNNFGQIEYNYGTVGCNQGNIQYNGQYSSDDIGHVETNGTQEGGVDSGTIETCLGTVGTNYGTINNVTSNSVGSGTVGTNEGTIGNVVGGTVGINNGTINANVNGSTVIENNGIINLNHGSSKVGKNNISGEVDNTYGGTVETNYGKVTYGNTIYYGIHGVDEDGTEYYYQKDNNFVGYNPNTEEVDLDELVKSYAMTGDYKLSSYTVWTYNKDSNADDKLEQQNVADTTKYSISAPTLLKLVWEEIASVVKPTEPATSSDGGKAVSASYSPRYIGLGSVIFINEKGYKVVEIKYDAFVVVSFDALSDEDVKDLDALFAKLFTAEQREQIKNVGQLLDAEDVLTIFGKPGNHPVFEVNKTLVQ